MKPENDQKGSAALIRRSRRADLEEKSNDWTPVFVPANQKFIFEQQQGGGSKISSNKQLMSGIGIL